jgi:hypothetical protein
MTPMRQDLAAPAWLAPQDLSAAGQDAHVLQVAVDGQGNAIAVWQRFACTNYIAGGGARGGSADCRVGVVARVEVGREPCDRLAIEIERLTSPKLRGSSESAANCQR